MGFEPTTSGSYWQEQNIPAALLTELLMDGIFLGVGVDFLCIVWGENMEKWQHRRGWIWATDEVVSHNNTLC